MLQETTGQTNANLSTQVVLTLPFMALRTWADEEQRVARAAEAAGGDAGRRQAAFGYGRSSQVIDDALADDARRLRSGGPDAAAGIRLHVYYTNELHVLRAADTADSAFLAWQAGPTPDRAAAAADAVRRLVALERWYAVATHIPRAAASRPPHTSDLLDAVDEVKASDPAAVAASFAAHDAAVRADPKSDLSADDWAEIDAEIARADGRLRRLGP